MVVEAAENADAQNSVWIPVIKRTVAKDGDGIDELGETIENHVAFLRGGGEWAARERDQLRSTFDTLIRETLFTRFLDELSAEGYDEIISKMAARDVSPWGAVESLLNGREK